MSVRGGSGRQTIQDDQLKSLLQVVYNVWFRKWKSRIAAAMSDDDWHQMITEAWNIMEQGEEYPIVKHLVITFLYELEARAFDGYTETTKDKLIKIIKEGRQDD